MISLLMWAGRVAVGRSEPDARGTRASAVVIARWNPDAVPDNPLLPHEACYHIGLCYVNQEVPSLAPENAGRITLHLSDQVGNVDRWSREIVRMESLAPVTPQETPPTSLLIVAKARDRRFNPLRLSKWQKSTLEERNDHAAHPVVESHSISDGQWDTTLAQISKQRLGARALGVWDWHRERRSSCS